MKDGSILQVEKAAMQASVHKDILGLGRNMKQ
jgi:hypothetical protein